MDILSADDNCRFELNEWNDYVWLSDTDQVQFISMEMIEYLNEP